MKLLSIFIVMITICCASMQHSKLELASDLINQQLGFLERAILISRIFAERESYLRDSFNSDQKRLLLQKCCSMLGDRINYFMNKTNDIKRGLIDLLFSQGMTMETETRKTLEKESSTLSLELKQFFSVDLHDQYYEVGRSLSISEDELDKNFNIVNSMFASGIGGQGVPH